jgi:uncharacterized OB-fold protein
MSTLQPQPIGIPTGRTSAAAEPYWEGCRQHELRYQRCARCGAIAVRPSVVCTSCRSDELVWEVSAGTGRLYSWTVVWRPQQPAFQVPYAPAIVELDEGYWLMSAVIGCEPDDLRADLRVRVEFHPANDEITLPYVRPVQGG